MVFLYHKDCPNGRIFADQEVEGMLSQGWVDSPRKLAEAQTEVPNEDIPKKEVGKKGRI